MPIGCIRHQLMGQFEIHRHEVSIYGVIYVAELIGAERRVKASFACKV